MSTGVKVGGAAGLTLVAVGGIGLLAGGDGPGSTPGTTGGGSTGGTTGAGSPGGTPSGPNPTGVYGWLVSAFEDIRDSARFVLLQNVREARISTSGGAAPRPSVAGASAVAAGAVNVTITGDAPCPR